MIDPQTLNRDNLRIIKTGRDVETINQAAINGFMPLVKKVVPSKKIRGKFSVVQDTETGEIEMIGDYRHDMGGHWFKDKDQKERMVKVIDWTFYYPYHFELPFAAYLVPKDIREGERVFLEELIEDIIGSRWNQGDTFRLESCEAIWNGTDFEIQFSGNDRRDLIG
jgi:hypothetical protein